MIAIARVTVNHDGRGGTVADPWCGSGWEAKVRRTDIRLRLILPLSLALLASWMGRGFRFMVVVFLVLNCCLALQCWYPVQIHFFSQYLALASWF